MRGFFASRLNVDREQLPELTNGELMRAAGVDIATYHGWVYRGREMPAAAIEKLQAFYASLIHPLD